MALLSNDQDGSRAPGAAPASPEPIKVMHIVFSLSLGGLEGGVLKLSNGFDRARIEPSICSCRAADAVKGHLRPDVKLFELDRKQFGNDLRFVARLAGLLRRERPHVLHTHGWGTLIEGLVAARLASVPVVVHGEHGTLQARNIGIQRAVWGRVDQVLSVSSTLAERMADTIRFPLERIRTIHNGVDPERFSPDRRAGARASMRLVDTDVVVGTVGRLEPVKDQHAFIDAIALLARQGAAFKAIIAGDGSLREELEGHAARVGVSDRVDFLGMRLDVEHVMASFDVFVLSSKSEGLSNTILEAMASGLPIVATDVGGAREMVTPGVHGVLVPPLQVEPLAGAIGDLVADAGRRQAMGKSSRMRATSQFSLTGMIRNYEDLYVELTMANGARR